MTGLLFFLIVLTLNQKVTKKVEIITIFHSSWPIERPTTFLQSLLLPQLTDAFISIIKLLGSERRLKDKTACLLVRTRGLHLDEKHILCDGEPMSGALVDFGLYFFHNVHIRLANGSAPYYYLPKMETHLETRLWNDVFKSAQDYMKVPQG